MQIIDNFDTQTMWTAFSGDNNYQIANSKLTYTNQSAFGSLLSPYDITNYNSVEFDIQLINDYAGLQHGGCWLYDNTKNQWLRFAFINSDINVNQLINQSPRAVSSFSNEYHEALEQSFNKKTFKMRLEIRSTTVRCLLDDVLINERNVGWIPVGFALFAYGCQIAIDNLVIRQQNYIVSGNSKQDDGIASRFILINDWQTGNFVAKVIPQADGAFEYIASSANKLIISHIGADGFAPRIDAPITPLAT